MTNISISRNESHAMKAWEHTDSDFDVMSFANIASNSGLHRSLVRRTVRSMARKGVTKYYRGCWTEDGNPAGSGYGLTPKGRELLKRIVPIPRAYP